MANPILLIIGTRTERLNLDLSGHRLAATTAVACEVVTRAATAAATVAARRQVLQEAVADSSISLTFVTLLFPMRIT